MLAAQDSAARSFFCALKTLLSSARIVLHDIFKENTPQISSVLLMTVSDDANVHIIVLSSIMLMHITDIQ